MTALATEAMEAAIDDLFSCTDVETITATSRTGETEASRGAAAKLGFRYVAEVMALGRAMMGYTLVCDDWLRHRP